VTTATATELATVEELARYARATALKVINRTGIGHAAADMSAADILAVLYGAVLDVSPAGWDDNERDRFVCSKSHASGALYSVLAWKGFLPEDELYSYGQPGSRLCTAVSSRLDGVEFSTGALGHGLPFAVGAAIAARLDGSPRRVYVMTGDGELQEGSNWEAAMLAATRELDNLTLVVDRNRVQKGASTEDINALEPLRGKFETFGWAVREVDGHDPGELLEAFRATPFEPGRPSCVLAETVKGKGVSFMENHLEWHSKRLTDADMERALAEIWGDDPDAG
jgi:transketolase